MKRSIVLWSLALSMPILALVSCVATLFFGMYLLQLHEMQWGRLSFDVHMVAAAVTVLVAVATMVPFGLVYFHVEHRLVNNW